MTRTNRPEAPRTGEFLLSNIRLSRGPGARVILRWEIAAASVPESVIPRGAAPFLMLEWSLPITLTPTGRGEPGRAAEARAEMVNPQTGARAVLAVVAPSRDDLAGPVRCTVEQDLHHIEIDGLLSATLRIRPGGGDGPASVQVLYARTTLLAQLGIPGGRYEAPIG